MNKILLALIGMMSLNLLQASDHEFDWQNPRLISKFVEKGLMTYDKENCKSYIKRPIDKAIFVAIRNGAPHELIQALLTQSYTTSKSKEFDDYMELEIKKAYRSYSPEVLELKDRIMYAQKSAERKLLKEKLEKFESLHSNNSTNKLVEANAEIQDAGIQDAQANKAARRKARIDATNKVAALYKK